MHAEKDSLEHEVLKLPRKIILQSLVCEESSITLSGSSFFVIDDTAM